MDFVIYITIITFACLAEWTLYNVVFVKCETVHLQHNYFAINMPSKVIYKFINKIKISVLYTASINIVSKI